MAKNISVNTILPGQSMMDEMKMCSRWKKSWSHLYNDDDDDGISVEMREIYHSIFDMFKMSGRDNFLSSD